MTLSSPLTVDSAVVVVERCRVLAGITDVPGIIQRTFLSPASRRCIERVRSWMEDAGLSASLDPVGNLRGLYPARTRTAPRLIIGSHLDTVPDAGAFDGILGVMIGLALLEHLNGTRLSFQIELVGFSEEEGVRFKTPFIGSRALVRQAGRDLLSREDANGVTVEQAIVDFGLQPDRIGDAAIDSSAFGFLEFHIEQGPVLESLDRSLGIVNAIAGQTRGEIIFSGNANHAGTTPMHLRRDALAGASEWIGQVEDIARSTRNLVATVGRIEVTPGAGNVIASRACMSLDIRHSNDEIRITATKTLVDLAHSIAQQRRLCCEWRLDLEQAAVRLDPALSNMAVEAVRAAGSDPVIMVSGAGHDAMILAEHIPSSMIFLRSPGGVSHHPDETVKIEDVHDAIAAGICFLNSLDTVITGTNA